MSKPTVHLAGPRVTVGLYAIQRCLLCGAVLSEYNARYIASPDGSGPGMLLIGGFYEFEGNRMSLVGESDTPNFASDLDIPENSCIRELFEQRSGGT